MKPCCIFSVALSLTARHHYTRDRNVSVVKTIFKKMNLWEGEKKMYIFLNCVRWQVSGIWHDSRSGILGEGKVVTDVVGVGGTLQSGPGLFSAKIICLPITVSFFSHES